MKSEAWLSLAGRSVKGLIVAFGCTVVRWGVHREMLLDMSDELQCISVVVSNKTVRCVVHPKALLAGSVKLVVL